MNDIIEPSEDDELPGDASPDDILNDALLWVEEAIENLLSLMGEGEDSLLTDWLVVAVSQGFSEDGKHPFASPAMILPKRYLPQHRMKGLLIDGLDQLRASDAQIVVLNSEDLGGDDE